MLKGYAKNRLLVGIGKAQHFLLDLRRKLAAQQAIAGAGEVAAVVVELGQDFAQLCLPTAIRPPTVLPRRGSGRSIACKALPSLRIPCEPRGCHNRSLQRRHSCQAEDLTKPSKMIPEHASSMAEISYVKRNTTSFCKKACCVAYEDRGKEIGRRDLRLADG